MNKHAITIQHLVKRYKKSETNAVDDISLHVNEGEFFAFLGPNGAGKTTTISILTTTLSKTSGSVHIAGFDLDTHESEIRQRVGIIFQKPSLDANLTAEENIRYHAALYNVYPFRPTYSFMSEKYKKHVFELADIVGIKDDLFAPIKTFSGGMKRKLEIVRSLIHRPQILFLDEPTSGLDPQSRRALWEYLQGVRKKHKMTIFLTTHYLDEAEGADRICIINHGKVVFDDTPAKIKKTMLKQHITIDSHKRDELKRELLKMNIDFKGYGPFTIPFDNITPQKLIHMIHTPLSHLSIYQPSLEEAYLQIIGYEQTA